MTRALGALLLLFTLAVARLGSAADARPVVRVTLVTGGDAPPWFDGFVKHLDRELGLRGIEVSVTRSERDATTLRSAGTSAAGADAELVVEASSALRPVLRFAVPARDPTATGEGGSGAHVRQINLAGVPSDACALALAAAADELMRSNWPRAVPSEATRAAVNEQASPSAGDGSAASPSKAAVDAQRPAVAQPAPESSNVAARSAPSADGESSDAAAEHGAASPGASGGLRSTIGVAAAAEAFTGGQTQLGADLRWAVRLVPRLDVEVRGGWRRILRQETTHGAVDGSALVAGGALRILVLGGARANLSLVGRADVLRVVYAGDARDMTVAATTDSALGFVVSAGPRGRIALTRALGIEAEVLAGAAPFATTATDAGHAVFATNGAALLGSFGLSFGF